MIHDEDDAPAFGSVESEVQHCRTLLIGVRKSALASERLLHDIKFWVQFVAGMLTLIAAQLIWGWP